MNKATVETIKKNKQMKKTINKKIKMINNYN